MIMTLSTLFSFSGEISRCKQEPQEPPIDKGKGPKKNDEPEAATQGVKESKASVQKAGDDSKKNVARAQVRTTEATE
ncbi:hypothetical protein NL676_027126 [Syzygium grande]|nr:hypothetical protein NL676_027126 [Syzygium grande]